MGGWVVLLRGAHLRLCPLVLQLQCCRGVCARVGAPSPPHVRTNPPTPPRRRRRTCWSLLRMRWGARGAPRTTRCRRVWALDWPRSWGVQAGRGSGRSLAAALNHAPTLLRTPPPSHASHPSGLLSQHAGPRAPPKGSGGRGGSAVRRGAGVSAPRTPRRARALTPRAGPVPPPCWLVGVCAWVGGGLPATAPLFAACCGCHRRCRSCCASCCVGVRQLPLSTCRQAGRGGHSTHSAGCGEEQGCARALQPSPLDASCHHQAPCKRASEGGQGSSG